VPFFTSDPHQSQFSSSDVCTFFDFLYI